MTDIIVTIMCIYVETELLDIYYYITECDNNYNTISRLRKRFLQTSAEMAPMPKQMQCSHVLSS